MESIMEKLRAEGEAKGWAEGVAEGEALGLAKGEAKSLVRLLERRFGPLSDANRERIERANLEETEGGV